MPMCVVCGGNVKAVDKFCNECGGENKPHSSFGPTGPAPGYKIAPTTRTKISIPSANSVSKKQKKYVYWLGFMIFLLVLGKGHTWHVTMVSTEEDGENFRGNYSDTRSVELYHDLLGWKAYQTDLRDYPGEENDTTDSSGVYYKIDSEFIDQSEYRTSIETKEVTTFLMNISLFLTGISFLFIVLLRDEAHVRSSVSTLSFLSGIVMLVAIVYFTLNFTPFEDTESSSGSNDDSMGDCSDSDSFGVGAFGYVEYTGCEEMEFDSTKITLTPGAGFYEMILYMSMCFLTPIVIPNRR